jgi:hypothetical protein
MRKGRGRRNATPVNIDVEFPDELIERTRVALAPLAGGQFSREDAAESLHNLVGFFGVLERWAREDGLLKDDPLGEATHQDAGAGGPEVAAPESPPDPASRGPEGTS